MSTPHTQALGAEVALPSGAIRGHARNRQGVLVFKGIPYAAPPVGDLRWRPPQPCEAWEGTREALEFGKPCFAAPVPGLEKFASGQSEDCLTLNIWTAAQTPGEMRPVMVWIHGGGFQFGASAFPASDGSCLAEKGVVLVSINYRLGVFGFLAHPELDAEGSPSGNFGLQDQIKALQWVREHIARFGGDPETVTVFGESAGAHATGLLMASPQARGLFHRAIGESGAFWDSEHGSLSTQQEAHGRGRALMHRLGVTTTAQMRAISPERLHQVTAWNFLLDPGVTAFSPHIDGFILTQPPAQTFAQGRQVDIPLLGGWNKAEHDMFMSRALPHNNAQAFRRAAAQQFGEARLGDFLAVYPAGTKAEAKKSAELLTGDLVIREQTWEWLATHSQTATSPVFVFNFDYTSFYAPKAGHTAEIRFVFGTLNSAANGPPTAPANTSDRDIAHLMMAYWINFARTGDPNGADLPRWPVYDAASAEVMQFATPCAAMPEQGTGRFAFIQSFRRSGSFPLGWRHLKGRLPAAVAHVLVKGIFFARRLAQAIAQRKA